jgi:hypothetical protein
MVNERFWFQISELTKRGFQLGHDKATTFAFICQALNYGAVDETIVKQWFESSFAQRSNDVKYNRLVEKTTKDYRLYKSAVFKCETVSGLMLDLRYGCVYNKGDDEQSEIQVNDYYHDQAM